MDRNYEVVVRIWMIAYKKKKLVTFIGKYFVYVNPKPIYAFLHSEWSK